MSDIETPIARVRGHGSAREGADHWWTERLTSLSTLLLFVWLAVSLLTLPDLEHRTVTAWLASPLGAVPMILLVISTFWHSKLGLQVVVEDYVHEEGSKLFWLVLINFGTILAASFALFAILKVAFAAGPGAVA